MLTAKRSYANRNSAGQEGRLRMAVRYSSEMRPISDDFRIEIVGQDTWKPDQDHWEVEHTFQGLVPGEPCTLRIVTGEAGAEPIEFRLYTPQPEAQQSRIPDYLVEITDEAVNIFSLGSQAKAYSYPRFQSRSLRQRIVRLPSRRGVAIGLLALAAVAGLFYLLYPFNDDDDARLPIASSSRPAEQVEITFRATRLGGSQEMLVTFENELGGTEEHVTIDETWEYTAVFDSNQTVWLDVRNLSAGGAVRCELLARGEPWITATSSGPGVTASCSGYPAENAPIATSYHPTDVAG